MSQQTSKVRIENEASQTINPSTAELQSKMLNALGYGKKVRVDKAGGGITYVGIAEAGSATSAASWKILRVSKSGTVTAIDHANGEVAEDKVWDNRLSYTY